MVEGEIPEPRVPHRDDMLVVFDEPLLAEVGLVNLAHGFVLVEEPVVPKGLGVRLLCRQEGLGSLGLDSRRLPWAALHTRNELRMLHTARNDRSRRAKA